MADAIGHGSLYNKDEISNKYMNLFKQLPTITHKSINGLISVTLFLFIK